MCRICRLFILSSNYVRLAVHVGNAEFPNSGNVYYSMIDDFMQSSIHDIEFLLERYKVGHSPRIFGSSSWASDFCFIPFLFL